MDSQSSRLRRAFTLVELLVVIAIIGTLMGLLLPAVQNARESGRSNVCRSNLANLQKAMTSYETSNKEFPGYVNPIGIMGDASASWGVMMLPYIEQTQLWEQASAGKQVSAEVEIFVCPSNPPRYEGGPAMSYLANAGWYRREGSIADQDCAPKENPANGVFFDRTRTADGVVGASDVRDLGDHCNGPESDPIIKMNFANIQAQGDGSTHTLMLAEGINAQVWTGIAEYDKKWNYGFCWGAPADIQQATTNGVSDPLLVRDDRYKVINGIRELLPDYNGGKAPNAGTPSSYHPGGVNVAFIGGQVIFLSERINPIVFAQLMTSNRKLSDLAYNNRLDRDMSTPGPDDY
jgi:prepilin-type N-terminal cleavage/methylation domain-containing protein